MNNGDMPANPVERNGWWDSFLKGEAGGKSYGLTKREEFAKAAMQGLLSNHQFLSSVEKAAKFADIDVLELLKESVSVSAVEHADALLAALEGEK